MADLLITDIPDAVFAELQVRAHEAGLSLEDYARRLICDAVVEHWHKQDADITMAQLRDTTASILRVAAREPVFVADDDGQRFVLISVGEYDRLADPIDTPA
ncbi:hypothetical protein So717_07990 [Roseobacter cerasinus]|uniref:Antitoxin FitA-like ribbon-helix-helix domain-containing protein n=1 Tax=Roseobacter cerasinus TaxID=2602289 RepID=A0A640VS59_9RHOB|nr:hypothetical protein [Roseobacter cerasinus]GFE49046.1 hypothetical protein So717_07990 [Roseobacter cerasinus]